MNARAVLGRSLWAHDDADARARRQRVLLALPLIVPISFAIAPYAMQAWNVSFVVAGVTVTIALTTLLYVCALAEAGVIAAFGAQGKYSTERILGIACDMLVGSIIGRLLAGALDTNMYAAVSIGATVLPVYNLIVAQFMLGGIGEAIGGLLSFEGHGIPAPPQYSFVDSLAARGNYDEALAELERAATAAPRDVEPLLRGARLLRDRARRHEDAVAWFRRARQRLSVPSDLDAQTGRECAELLLYTLHSPQRAAPELSRLARDYRGTACGHWAEVALAEAKEAARRTS